MIIGEKNLWGRPNTESGFRALFETANLAEMGYCIQER